MLISNDVIIESLTKTCKLIINVNHSINITNTIK